MTVENPHSEKDANVLVIMEHFTCYAQAIVTTSQMAQVTAKALWNQFFMHYGFPAKILSDQRQKFKSELIKELCMLADVRKLRAIPYHPEGIGQCKRFNSTLMSMIGTSIDKDKSHWKDFVWPPVHSTIVHAITPLSLIPTTWCLGRSPGWLWTCGLVFKLRSKWKCLIISSCQTWMRNLGGPTIWLQTSRIAKPRGISNNSPPRPRVQP